MNRLLKSALLIIIFLSANASFAECNTDPELKLIKFSPSNLAVYLPKTSIVEKDVYNYHDGYSARYNIIYKNKPIIITIESKHSIDLADVQGAPYETTKLTNISDTAELKKWVCNNKICSYSLLKSDNIVSTGYNTTISYTLPMKEDHIGEAFMKSLFVDDYKCEATESDSIINRGPFKIDVKFDSNSSTVLPQYHDNIAAFAKFINENEVSINIEGHTDKAEVLIDSEVRKYSLELSEKRAEAVRYLLIELYGVDPAKIKETTAESYQRPLADNDTKEGRKMNRRAIAYIGRGNMSDK